MRLAGSSTILRNAGSTAKEKEPMNPDKKASRIDTKVLLSTLWLFAVLNYLYCDVVGLMDANLLKQYIAGSVGGMVMNQGFLLGAGVYMEMSIAMVLLSRVLGYKANRFTNIIAGIIATLVQIATLLRSPTPYYIFFSIVEVAATLFIVWTALRWREGRDDVTATVRA